MAKVSDTKNAPPQIGRPVGSLEEVRALGVPTRNIATCSAHAERDNMGCPVWEWCDRAYRGTAPQNEIAEYIGPEGDTRDVVRPCFDWVKEEVESLENGTLITIKGYAGEKYYARGSVKRHVERDPDCNDCTKGKCEAYDDSDAIEHVCPEFPAAAVHPELRKFARKMDARSKGAQRTRAARRVALLGGNDEEVVDAVADTEGKTERKSRFGRGSRS